MCLKQVFPTKMNINEAFMNDFLFIFLFVYFIFLSTALQIYLLHYYY